MRQEVKLLQPLFSGTVETARKAQDSVGALEARVLGEKVKFIPQLRELFQADWAVPDEPLEHSCILYLHGGGYTAGSLDYARGFGGIIADLTHRSTLCVAYRLAPENPFPAALDDAYEAYRYIRRSYTPEHIAVVGESAGGGLSYALCLRLRDEGVPLPACVVALSPWTDLSLSLDAVTRNASLDPSLTRDMLSMYARMYAPGKYKEPYVSPLFGDLHGMPPSMIFAGSHEILEDDSVEMAKKLQEAGCSCTLHIEDGAWHVYVLYGIYEARQALKKIAAFIGEKTLERD